MNIYPKVIENDAIVVLCLQSLEDYMTHHDFKLRAANRGFTLTKSDCHNMLHRAVGRVGVDNNNWRLTAAGWEYRRTIIETIMRVLAAEPANLSWSATNP